MTRLVLLYRERDRQALTRLMEDFRAKAAKRGVGFKVSDLHDL